MNIEVLDCALFTKEDYNNIKYLFSLQENNPNLVVINFYIDDIGNSLFPYIKYYVYIEETFCSKLKKEDEKFKNIYYDWIDDLYQYDDICGKDKRCTEIIKTIELDR